jgi:GTP-binding protein YchF
VGAEVANYPFCTIEPNVGIVPVPDSRLDVLGKMYNTQKITPAVLKFVDIAGLVKGASRGEGLGNKFLGAIRECDAIVHVVRCFDDANITHVDGSVDPIRDIETINTELALADLDTVSAKLSKVDKLVKQGNKDAAAELDLLTRMSNILNEGKPARLAIKNEDEQKLANSYFLLTTKPVIYACNISEKDISKNEDDLAYVCKVKEFAKTENSKVLVICAKIEQELSELDDEEKQMFLDDLGLKSSGLERIIKIGYETLGQISYLTAGEKEVRAWTILKGTKAPGAAGKIHSDFEKGFIRADVVSYDNLVAYGSYNAAKDAGKVRSEGKDYEVQDGDVMLFKFNV